MRQTGEAPLECGRAGPAHMVRGKKGLAVSDRGRHIRRFGSAADLILRSGSVAEACSGLGA